MPPPFPLTPTSSTSDPFCEGAFCDDFDTTLYNYARFIGTKIGRYYDVGGGELSSGNGGQIVSKTESNSNWLFIGNSSPDGCFLTNRFSEITATMLPDNPSGSSITPEGNHKWVANYNSWSTAYFNSSFGSGAQESPTYWFRDGVFQNSLDPVNPSTAALQPNEMYLKVQGKWQFKYATSQPLTSASADAEWIGNQSPLWTNPDSSFSTPVTVPPYYNS